MKWTVDETISRRDRRARQWALDGRRGCGMFGTGEDEERKKTKTPCTGAAGTLHVCIGACSAERNLVHLECPQAFVGAGVLFLIDAQAGSGVR